jgi:hypothetical protein
MAALLDIYPFADRAQEWPDWSQSYTLGVNPSNLRTNTEYGYVTQRSRGNRYVTGVDVERVFTGPLADEKLAYFEVFIRDYCRNGSDKFLDRYADGNGMTLGPVRILGGSYNVSSNGMRHKVTCQLEIFRNAIP